MNPLQELAAYAAAGRIKRPEEYLRLARLSLTEVAEQIDKHPVLPNGDKWRLLNSHPSEGGAGLTVLSRLIEHTEGRMLEALEEALDGLDEDDDDTRPFPVQPQPPPFSHQREGVGCHEHTPLSADAALHDLSEVR